MSSNVDRYCARLLCPFGMFNSLVNLSEDCSTGSSLNVYAENIDILVVEEDSIGVPGMITPDKWLSGSQYQTHYAVIHHLPIMHNQN